MVEIDYRSFCQEEMGITLDKWQEKLIKHEGNLIICAGRQVGKSTGVALKTYFAARDNPNHNYLVIAAAQRQSSYIFEKISGLFVKHSPEMIEGEPTKTRLKLNNGTNIYCVPSGRTGYSIRCYTINGLIADEAPYISEAVWVAVVPMLATTGGWQILFGTPFGKGGYFYRCWGDSDFLQIHLSSERCPRIPKKFLQKEKSRLSKLEYAQEYLGEFIEEIQQLFPTKLIKDRCNFIRWSYKEEYKLNNAYYLGVDPARYGGDENAFVITQLLPNDTLKVIKVITTKLLATTDTIGRIIALEDMFNFRRIFIDDSNVGGTITDVLIEKIGRKVVGINNASRPIDKDGRRKKLLKEDLYSNLLVLMEQKKIDMIDLPELKRSLASVRFEYTADRNLKIYGLYTHIAEALVRAAWCIKAKGLNIYLY